MDGRCATAERDGAQAGAFLELALEGGDIRTNRGQPVGSERLLHIALLGSAHVGHRERDSHHIDSPRRASTSGSPRQSSIS